MKLKFLFIFLLPFTFILAGLSVNTEAAPVYVNLVSPNGGETYTVGQTVQIQWEDNSTTLCVEFYLSTDSGQTYTKRIGETNTGSFEWTVPDMPTTNARVRACVVACYSDDYQGPCDYSDADFTIRRKLLAVPSVKTEIPTVLTVPAVPSNLQDETLGPFSIRLTWEDNSSNETGFRIYRDGSKIAEVGAGVETYTDTGLDCSMNYAYGVLAYNAAGSSQKADCGHPSYTASCKPTDLSATALSGSEIRLTWTDNSNFEKGFKIDRDGTEIKKLGADTVTYTDSGLEAGRTYTYRVRAYLEQFNEEYDIGKSNETSATTLSQTAAPETPVTPETPAEPETPPAPDIPAPTAPGDQTVIRLYIGNTEYYVNNTFKSMDAAPIIREQRTMLPIRYVAEPLGAEMVWDAAEQKVSINMRDRSIELWIGQNRARVNGREVYLDPGNSSVAPVIIPPGRTMLPLRFIAENLGCEVAWNATLQEVTITYTP